MPRSAYSCRSDGNSAPPPTAARVNLQHLAPCRRPCPESLQIVGRTGIGGCADVHRGAGLQFGLAGSGRQNRRADGPRAVFKNHARRCQVVAEKQFCTMSSMRQCLQACRNARPPPVMACPARFVNRPGATGSTCAKPTAPLVVSPPKGGAACAWAKIGFAQHRQPRQILDRHPSRSRVDHPARRPVSRSAPWPAQSERGRAPAIVCGALIWVSGLQLIEIRAHRPSFTLSHCYLRQLAKLLLPHCSKIGILCIPRKVARIPRRKEATWPNPKERFP